jgi:adenylate cyclase
VTLVTFRKSEVAKRSSRLYRTLGELRRRHVIRVVGAYAVCTWLTLQVVAIIFPALMVPDWVLTVLVVLGLAGLPVVAILTWVYDITPAGVVRTIPADAPPDERFPIPAHWNWRWLDYIVIVALLTILAYMLINRESEDMSPARSIAVLPFSDLSDDGDHSYFSDGLAEALIDSLASVPGLRVMSRTSSFSFVMT